MSNLVWLVPDSPDVRDDDADWKFIVDEARSAYESAHGWGAWAALPITERLRLSKSQLDALSAISEIVK